jgi:phospho-N-acetylmuramoyl-pentapeptide-transferase
VTSRIILFFSALIVSLLITFPVVKVLEFLKFSQHIRDEGPASHKLKSGTLTMGGIGFVLTILAFALIFIDFEIDFRYLALILLTFGFAAVGLLDDIIKVFRHRNEGLTFWQKIILQTSIAAGFSAFLIYFGQAQSVDGLLKTLWFSNPIIYFLFSVFIIVGTANAANLTDGLNGLLAGTGSIAFMAFAILSLNIAPYATTFSLTASAAILAFLYFNFPKARVFMGDVGSLSIGAALAGIAIIIHKELWLVIIGGIFFIEALSVILQVTSYKLFKKRIFKMTPLHHHFELLGKKETAIVIGFWIVAVILGVVGVLI